MPSSGQRVIQSFRLIINSNICECFEANKYCCEIGIGYCHMPIAELCVFGVQQHSYFITLYIINTVKYYNNNKAISRPQ
ncbi:hypothetical protein BLOT_010345 [Blomia tropicalis]|nr:hypothetical protein BLOT_010345 [Blomia tropicalis]